MRPEQRTTFRIFAATSVLFTAGCEAINAFHSSRDAYGSEPVPLSSPLPTQPSRTEFVTATPFLPETPVAITPIVEGTSTPTVTETPFREPFSLSSESPIRLDKENTTYLTMQLGKTESVISFVPKPWNADAKIFKELCPVGTEFGCTYSSGNRTFVFIDSGWFDNKAMAGEGVRNYFEGSYPMRTVEERTKRLDEMIGKTVTIKQYNGSWTGEVLAAIYVPPDHVDAFTKDLTKGPEYIASVYPQYADAVAQGIVFVELCGWDRTLPEDTAYTASRYMIIIGDAKK